jgi:hypothetical protein
MRNRHVRAYRALLRVYPRRFRAEYEEEMCRVFAQQLHYARVMDGWPGVVRVWARSLVDLVTTAPSEYLEEEMLVASPVGASTWHPTQDASPPPRRWVLIGLAPLWALLASLLVPSWGGAVFSNPPSILGLPAGGAAVGLACAWGLIGLRSLVDPRSSRLRAVVLTFLILTIVAGFLMSWHGFGQLVAVIAAGLAALWWAFGRPPVSQARPSTVRLASLLLFTVPSTAAVLLAPAGVLIVLNLTT